MDFALFYFYGAGYTAEFLFSPDYLRKKGVRVIHKCGLYTAVYGRSVGQFIEKPCEYSRGHSFCPIFIELDEDRIWIIPGQKLGQ